jgi:hypothetical protein
VSLLDTIRSAHGERALPELGRRYGLDEAETRRALDALVPELGGTFLDRNAGPRAAAIHAAIEDKRHERFLSDPAALASEDA